MVALYPPGQASVIVTVSHIRVDPGIPVTTLQVICHRYRSSATATGHLPPLQVMVDISPHCSSSASITGHDGTCHHITWSFICLEYKSCCELALTALPVICNHCRYSHSKDLSSHCRSHASTTGHLPWTHGMLPIPLSPHFRSNTTIIVHLPPNTRSCCSAAACHCFMRI